MAPVKVTVFGGMPIPTKPPGYNGMKPPGIPE